MGKGPFPSLKAAPLSFEQWRSQLPQNLQGAQDYDLRGAYAAHLAPAPNGHLPDDYKLPNHMTFSDDSRYSNQQHQGGQWRQAPNGQWVFWASPYNMAMHSAGTLSDYFKQYEPGSTLVLPINYNLPRR